MIAGAHDTAPGAGLEFLMPKYVETLLGRTNISALHHPTVPILLKTQRNKEQHMDRTPGTTLRTLILCAIIATLAACTTYNHQTAGHESAEAAKIRSEN